MEPSLKSSKGPEKIRPGWKPALPVDHGWAWWIMVGYFVNLLIVIFWIRALAIMFPVFLDKYNQSTSVTTLAFGISELTESFAHISLPLYFMHRFSVRTLTLFGAVLTVSAILSLCIAANIVLLYVAFAVMGFARGFIVNPQIYLLGVYFKKRLSFASSAANTGLSMATLVSPLLTQLLLDTYGLRGTYLIFGAITMHSIVGAMLLRPISMYNTDGVLDTQETRKDKLGDEDKIKTIHAKSFTSKEDIGSNSTEDQKTCALFEAEGRNFVVNNKNKDNGINGHEDSNLLESNSEDTIDKGNIMASEEQGCKICKKTYASSIITNPTALFVILAGVVGTQTQCGNVYMPVLGLENGLNTHQLPWLMIISGISDVIGKLVFGLVADRGFLHPSRVVCLTLLTAGTLLQFVSFFQGMLSMVLFSIFFGLNAGMIMSLLSPITIAYVGLANLPAVTSGYFIGSCMLTFLCHIVIGGIKDLTGSFAGGYQFTGAMMLAGMFFLVLAEWSYRHNKNRLKEKRVCDECNDLKNGHADNTHQCESV